MPHTALGSAHNNTTSATITLTTTAAVPAGDTILVGCGGFKVGPPTATLSGGSLTWTTDKAGNNGSDVLALARANAPAGLASGTVLTLTWSLAVAGPFIAAASFPNIITASPVDQSSTANPATGTAWAAASITTTVTDTVVGLSWADGTSSSSAPTAPWVEAFDATDTASLEEMTLVYQESVAAGSYAPAGAWGVSEGGKVVLAVGYKVSAGAAAVLLPRRRLIRPRTIVPSGGRFAR